MVTLEQVVYVVPILGLTASIFYYAKVLRNSNKAQQLQQETRKIQLLLEFNQGKIESAGLSSELLTAEWTDFNDWFTKYGQFNNPESYALRLNTWENFNVNVLLVRDGLIDIQTYIEYMGDMPLVHWEKYQDIIVELRERFLLPTYMSGYEFLAKEIEEYRNSHGWSPKTAPREQFADIA
jgi:hypothetical protein